MSGISGQTDDDKRFSDFLDDLKLELYGEDVGVEVPTVIDRLHQCFLSGAGDYRERTQTALAEVLDELQRIHGVDSEKRQKLELAFLDVRGDLHTERGELKNFPGWFKKGYGEPPHGPAMRGPGAGVELTDPRLKK
ncbi:MAG: hypothetical protein UY92_C0001G0005 [Candidatus Magasanikbacteria bacterium GW2011_GWA2_56_11]|uniref:Uncharacterized protein n=1 Tax=Candidatus Magasanikbacteria bacterium GW2011_GWA2_56_11 TaxID=1619044 RepID=A0A0G1YIC1_9BACT|nr:MAG: hypothetical protein UY92_C0001G0005 [Candidatus Magasanikbacteria bacterium GW2011_GWA2_56_11]